VPDTAAAKHHPTEFVTLLVAEARDHVDHDVYQRVVAAAAEEGVSVSAWTTAAARRTLLIRDWVLAVREWEKEHGAFTEAEHA
jgi:hypothetical protein